MNFIKATLLAAVSAVSFTASAASANASSPRELAAYNSTYIMSVLQGADDLEVRGVITKFAKGTLQRPAPSYPVWILETQLASILYYEGNPSFADKAASLLVDDAGSRFGSIAIANAEKSKSSWLTLKLNQRDYPAYCHAQAPLVVCTLIP